MMSTIGRIEGIVTPPLKYVDIAQDLEKITFEGNLGGFKSETVFKIPPVDIFIRTKEGDFIDV